MRKTPTGQRPQLNKAQSSSWRWPRLVPIQESHARASQESRTSARSSRAQSVHGKSEQTPAPAELTETLNTQGPLITDAVPQASDFSAAGSASPVGEFGTEPTEGRNSSEADDSVSPFDMDEIPPSDHALPQSPILSAASRTSPVGDTTNAPKESRHSTEAAGNSPVAGSSGTGAVDRRHSNQSEVGSSTVGQPGTGLTEDRHSNEAEATASQKEYTGTEMAGHSHSSKARSSISTISDLGVPPSTTQDHHMSNSVASKAIDDASDNAEQENSARPETMSNGKETEVQSVPEDEVPGAAAGTEATDVVSDEEPTPVAQAKDEDSVPDGPIPYYANPKIMVHKPSKSLQSDTSGPRTIDEILSRERTDLALKKHFAAIETPSMPTGTPGMPQITRLPTIDLVHKALKVKRRSLYLRKARNLAARKTILKVTLGRQLAVPTKQSLRQLASGESAVAGLPVVSQTLP